MAISQDNLLPVKLVNCVERTAVERSESFSLKLPARNVWDRVSRALWNRRLWPIRTWAFTSTWPWSGHQENRKRIEVKDWNVTVKRWTFSNRFPTFTSIATICQNIWSTLRWNRFILAANSKTVITHCSTLATPCAWLFSTNTAAFIWIWTLSFYDRWNVWGTRPDTRSS